MRRPILISAFAAGLLTLGACATLGEPVTLTMAELNQRCESRGGSLQATGAQTGRAQSDYICRNTSSFSIPGRGQATAQMGAATTAALQRGTPYGRNY